MAIQKLFTSLSKAAQGNTYIGENGRIFYDTTKGFRISDGVTPGGLPAAVAVTAANIGDLAITGATISTANANEDLSLSTNGTGNVNVYGSFKVHSDGIGSTVSFDAAANGLLTIIAPDPVPSGSSGALNIVGSADGSYQTVNGTGGLIHMTGNDNALVRVTMDGYLNAASGPQTFSGAAAGYGVIALRAARGTAASPSPTLKDDTLASFSGLGYIGGGYSTGQVAGLQFLAIENFSTGASGTYAQLKLAPAGTRAGVISTTFYANGIITSNIGVTNLTASGNTISTGTTHMIGNIISEGTTTLVGNVTMNADLIIDGNTINTGTTINVGTTQAIGNFTANGTSNLIGIVTTQGNLNVSGNLFIEGTSINTGTTLMIGNTTTEGTTTLIGDVHITGNVDTTGATANFGQATFTGNVDIAGPMSINNQIAITALGNVKFNDGTVQTTSAIQNIVNSGHITGSLNNVGAVKTLNLSSDATPTNTASTIVSRSATGDIAVGNITATTLSTTSVTANNSIAGSLTVYGNLNVVGTTVTTNAVVTTVNTKTFTIAANAVSTVAMDGAAFLVGNISGASTADWTYDNSQTAWRTNVSVVPSDTLDGQNLGSATRQWGNVYAGEAYLSNKLNVGVTPAIEYTTVAQFTSNVNNYSQVYAQNISSNSGASTDYVAANDVGGDVNNYIDMGINSSTYSDADYSIQYANDGYLYINGGNLTIGTQSTGSDLVFFTDGTLAANEAGRIHLSRWILGGTDNGVDKFQVTGTATISGNLTAGNVSATNLTNKFNTLTANTAGLYNSILGANAAIVTANTAMKGYVDGQITTVNSSITGANAAIVTANTAMKGYVDAVTTAWTANAATQQGQITTLQGQVYTNANVAAYLPTYSGNISAGNVIVGSTTYANLSITSTATTADFTIGQVGATGNLILNRNTNFVKDARITGNIRYDQTQNNATVTQLTSKATAVTANGRTGQITTNNATLNKGAAVQFTVNNTYITSAKDMVIVNIASGASVGYDISVNSINAAGSFIINLHNSDSTGSGANASDALVINFAVIKVN